jgi:hypothetical protein
MDISNNKGFVGFWAALKKKLFKSTMFLLLISSSMRKRVLKDPEIPG